MKQLIVQGGSSYLSPQKTQALVSQLFDIFDDSPNVPGEHDELMAELSGEGYAALLGDGDLNDAFAEFENEHDKNPFNLSATPRRR